MTKPGKDRGVIILDRNEYFVKLEQNRIDTRKFKVLNQDATISHENVLTTVLQQIKRQEYLAQQEYKYL